jgi:predicted esterase YcpF (UPF0227 family)
MNIFDYLKFDKTVSIYHGLGSEPNPMRNKSFNNKMYNVISELHDYVKEYELDLGESFFKRELEKVKNSNLILGISYGGYVAYHLSKATGINAILINPAINRSKSKNVNLNKDYIMNYTPRESTIEIFCGENDISVDPKITELYLKENDPNLKIEYIEDMAHRVPHAYFSQILKTSKLI